MNRIWVLQMNLDELNALVGMAFTDSDRALVLGGLVLGCNSGTLPEHCSRLVHDSYLIGKKWRDEAQGFKDKRQRGGLASVEARKLKFGDANPRTNREHNLNTVHETPEHHVNQSSILNPIDINTPKPKKVAARKTKAATSEIPSHLVSDLDAILVSWPRQSAYKNGQVQSLPKKISRVSDLYERMVRFFPSEDPSLMVRCGLAYLEKLGRESKGGMTQWACALTNFYGTEAKWKENINLVLEPEAEQPKMVYISTNPEVNDASR